MRKSGDFRGVGLGSQVIQTTQVTLLSGLDRYITETLGIKVYVRYMDDFVLVHESKEYLSYCWDMIKRFLAGLKLVLNPKTQLYRLEQGIILLHWRIIVTVTGKVVIHKHRVKINKQQSLYQVCLCFCHSTYIYAENEKTLQKTEKIILRINCG